VSSIGVFVPISGILIYETSFWDTMTEVVAGLRETAYEFRERKVWWNGGGEPPNER